MKADDSRPKKKKKKKKKIKFKKKRKKKVHIEENVCVSPELSTVRDYVITHSVRSTKYVRSM